MKNIFFAVREDEEMTFVLLLDGQVPCSAYDGVAGLAAVGRPPHTGAGGGGLTVREAAGRLREWLLTSR